MGLIGGNIAKHAGLGKTTKDMGFLSVCSVDHVTLDSETNCIAWELLFVSLDILKMVAKYLLYCDLPYLKGNDLLSDVVWGTPQNKNYLNAFFFFTIVVLSASFPTAKPQLR